MAIYHSIGNSNTRVLGSAENRYSTRTSCSDSGGSSRVLWTPLTYNKLSSTSELHVHGLIIGDGKNSYPFYGTFTRATWSGGNETMHIGSQYSIGAYINEGSVLWHINQIWRPGDLSNVTGNITFTCEYKSVNSNGARPFNTWNPNSSDDNRAYQMGSTFLVQEVEIA